MNYKVVIDPELMIDTSALAEAWNDDPQTQAVASATTEQPDAVAFPLDPVVGQYALLVLTSVAGLLATVSQEAVSELLKEKLQTMLASKLESPPQLDIRWQETNDGWLMVVEEEESA
ncbi:hypothetical protein QUF58_06830 [Anaerolineales bacterium HSG24]|nr:hypothetical protein [Anaerolineales bacterium HSG24]